jgi:hypothetical protein
MKCNESSAIFLLCRVSPYLTDRRYFSLRSDKILSKLKGVLYLAAFFASTLPIMWVIIDISCKNDTTTH